MTFDQLVVLLLPTLPLAGAVLVWCLGPTRGPAIRGVSVAVSLATLVLALYIAGAFLMLEHRLSLEAPGKSFTFVPEFVPGATQEKPHRTTWDLLPIGEGAHPVFPGRRWAQPLAGRAHRRFDAAVRDGVVHAHQRARERVLRLAAGVADMRDRRLPLLRHLPVLRLLRAVAAAVVLPHRHLGRGAAPVRRPQVLHLYPHRQSADLAGRAGDGDCLQCPGEGHDLFHP